MSTESMISPREADAFCDNPCEMVRYSGEQLFSIGQTQLDRIHLAGLRKRFAELSPNLTRLRILAEENRITALNDIHEVVPLLFPHTKYKSYPLSLIDNCRFEQLNAWLDELTTHDLSGLDVSACQSLDEWLAVVEAKTPVRVVTSSGTSGKISLLPRSTVEEHLYAHSFAVVFGKFRNEVGIADAYASTVYHVLPFPRRGRHSQSRSIGVRIEHGFHGDASHVLSFDEEMSTDVLWMTGRLKKAQADGMVEQLKKTKAWQRLSGKLAQSEAKKGISHEEFYRDMLIRLKDKTVAMALGFTYYWAMVECAEKFGLEIRFAPDSFLATAGGLKSVQSLSDAQIEKIKKTIPHQFQEIYGCSEIMGLSRLCPEGHFHMAPWVVSFVLDPDTGTPYPRKGIQTGRYAEFDLWATTYWGGLMTGDEVTLNWDGGCRCGRNGPYLYDRIARYIDKRGGDDKITCMRTAAAVEEMIEHMHADE